MYRNLDSKTLNESRDQCFVGDCLMHSLILEGKKEWRLLSILAYGIMVFENVGSSPLWMLTLELVVVMGQ